MIIDEKIGILDIRVKTAKGVQINIEIQLINQYNMIQRTIFYWSKLFFSQISTGSLYKDLKRTITINLLNFNYLEFEKFHTKHHIYEDETKEMLSDILEINFIEIPKFINGNKDLKNPLHRWLLFLANPEDIALEEIELEDSKIKKAHEILDSLNFDKETIRLAELREKYILDERSRIEGAREEGLKEGIKEGIEQGIEQGKINMAKEMILDGENIEKIKKYSKLNEKDIEKLREELRLQ